MGSKFLFGFMKNGKGQQSPARKDGRVAGLGSWKELVSVPAPAVRPITSVPIAREKYNRKYLFRRV